MKLKNHFILTSILCCIILSFGFRVHAEEKQYEIPQADFEIELMEDGSADVTEEWTLHYTTGSFSRFYKDIYKDVTRLEQYDDIDFKEFCINGVSCERVYDTDTRQDYTYYMSEENKLYNMQWYYHAEKETVVYQVKYTIKDVVKETDNNVALFCYRYVGKNFDKRVDHIKVKITAPGACKMELRYGEASAEDGGDYILLTDDYVNGMVKYNVALPADLFDGLTFIPLEDLKKDEQKNNSLTARNMSCF